MTDGAERRGSKVADIFGSMDYGPAPEDPGPAVAWIAAHGGRFELFIGGAWQPPADGAHFPTLNPASGQSLAEVAQGGAADVDRAVAAARAALPGWQAVGPEGRARYLYAIARRVQKHSRLFAVLETLDNGKPIRESRDIDIPLVARHFYHHAGWATLLPTVLPGYGAVGVVGQIIPWNFPLLMLAWKVAPALCAGNTVVLKPAEYTSLTALRFAELCDEIGLPPGVVNVVTGDGRTGEALVRHQDVDKIAFTGSTEVGRLIRVATAGSGKRLSLELGGKNPMIVCPDADPATVAGAAVTGMNFAWAGQSCGSNSRLLIHEFNGRFTGATFERWLLGYDEVGAAVELFTGRPVPSGPASAPAALEAFETVVGRAADPGKVAALERDGVWRRLR